MLRMLEAQAPAKQTATETISTLSSRLNNATLLEDRRGAILGLRSFAKEYPASVASGSLRALIASLIKDVDDVDTLKLVLETLLMLFKPNMDSPEAGEEIALWLADEFSQRDDNIKILLDLLQGHDFYPRLYSLQLLTAISASRPERSQECILSVALGTSRLVSTLDDPREPIRNAGLVLLADLTQSSTELQKLAAFEGVFEKLFHMLRQEGGLREGGIIVQDCLDLFANLVRQNTSNQSLFRETGCVPELSRLVRDAYLPTTPARESSAVEDLPSPQRDKNIWGLLAVIRLFLVSGSSGTQLNQKTFEKSGLLRIILNLAFRQDTDAPIRSEALYTCADMIRSNQDLQANFSQLQIPLATHLTTHHEQPNGKADTVAHTLITSALLNLVVASSTLPFNIRLAACEAIKAYLLGHAHIRLQFLRQAIQGYMSGQDDSTNAITILLRDGTVHQPDPYKIWFSAVIVLHLIWEDSEAKAMLMNVTEGDAASGEEVVTFIQTITGNLVAAMHRKDDERVLIANLTLLCAFLHETPEAVNDFLGEASYLQALIQVVSHASLDNVLVSGLSALLIGILYEYSTKDSSISRRQFQSILITSLGREKYLEALNKLRQHPIIRDYEVFEQASLTSHSSADLPPYAYFDATFIVFIKDNFGHFSRAIDRDPRLEVYVGAQENGVDRDLVDSLRSQIDGKNQALSNAENRVFALEHKLDETQATHRKEAENVNSELQRIKQINELLERSHEAETAKTQEQHTLALAELQSFLKRQTDDLQMQLASVHKGALEEAERTKDYYERSLSQARSSKSNMEARLQLVQKALDDTKSSFEESLKTLADLQSENNSWKRATESQRNAGEQKDKQLNKLQQDLERELHRSKEQEKVNQERMEQEVRNLDSKHKAAMDELRDTMNEQVQHLEISLKSQREIAEDEKTRVAMLEKEFSELAGATKDTNGQSHVDQKLKQRLDQAETEVKNLHDSRNKVQTELDDLFLMLQDIEEKRTRDKKRLTALGETVSDIEESGDDEDANQE